jgi:hypothetical protein
MIIVATALGLIDARVHVGNGSIGRCAGGCFPEARLSLSAPAI